jgi:hypothetical protein
LLGIVPYITLGAVVGQYYQKLSEDKKKATSFPFKDSLFTIQYQAWWNQLPKTEIGGQ